MSRRANYTREIAKIMRLELFSSVPSNSVTALRLPANIDGVKFRNDLEKNYQLTLTGGQDQLKGKIIRLGHMGYITDQDLHETSMRLSQCLNDYNYKINFNEIELNSKKLLESKV